MQHGYLYNGAFEANYPALRPGMDTYRTTTGEVRPLPKWPDEIDGVRASYMERRGKKFFVVRLQFAAADIVLVNPVPIDRMRHLGNQRLAAGPLIVDDRCASAMLDDAIAANGAQQKDIATLISLMNNSRRKKAGSRRQVEEGR
jgi:hypothetical protein